MSLTTLPFSHLDDSDFSAVIYEFRNGPVHFDPERLMLFCETKAILIITKDIEVIEIIYNTVVNYSFQKL